MNYFKKMKGGGFASLSLLLPFGLVIFGVIMLFKWIKKSGGLASVLDKYLGISNIGATVENNQSNVDMIEQAKKDLSKKNIAITALDRTLANSIFTLLNKQEASNIWTQFFSSTISDELQGDVLKILRSVSKPSDIAGIYVAYGSRPLPNRQSNWAGFLWDDNPLNLREAVEKHFSGSYKTAALAILDNAISTYLN